MTIAARPTLAEIESRVCDIASESLGLAREKISPASRIVEDLHADSLDVVELLLEIDEAFAIRLPDLRDTPHPVYKSVFTRSPFSLGDLAELVHMQLPGATRAVALAGMPCPAPAATIPFSQLGTRRDPHATLAYEPLGEVRGQRQLRRLTDGMRCVWLPGASVEIGSHTGLADEQPQHVVELDAFLIDAEPVSTTAFCRFLNTVGEIRAEVLGDWFVLSPDDDRREHELIARAESVWRPVAGAERWPMILVSWYGANAYSLWANGQDWRRYRDESVAFAGSFLPSEAQWEYAARGARYREFPWGDATAAPGYMHFAQHRRKQTYTRQTLPPG